MTPKLEDSWEDPFVVRKKFNRVNYLIEEEDGRHRKKVVHINSLKQFKERETEVLASTVIAEDQGLDEGNKCLHVEDCHVEDCEGFNEAQLEGVHSEFAHVRKYVPGSTEVVKMSISIEPGSGVISQAPYRIPDRLKKGVRNEILQLLHLGII